MIYCPSYFCCSLYLNHLGGQLKMIQQWCLLPGKNWGLISYKCFIITIYLLWLWLVWFFDLAIVADARSRTLPMKTKKKMIHKCIILELKTNVSQKQGNISLFVLKSSIFLQIPKLRASQILHYFFFSTRPAHNKHTVNNYGSQKARMVQTSGYMTVWHSSYNSKVTGSIPAAMLWFCVKNTKNMPAADL